MTPDSLDALPEVRPDEVISEVRANREAYAARFGYDVRAILRRSRERAAECEVGVEEREPRRLEPGAA